MNEIPPPNEGPDEADERYRRLSDRDPSGPSETVRRAVLRHAALLAAQARTQGNSATTDRSAAKGRRWRVPAYGGLAAAAVLAGLLMVPHFLVPPTPPVALPPRVASPPPAAPAPAPAPVPPPAEREADAQPMPGLARNSVVPPRAATSQTQSINSPAAAASARAFSLPRATSIADPAAALHEAARRGDVSTLRRLLAEKLNIDARDASGRTALMLAVLQGQKEVVNTLLAAGADPNAADASGTTPLQAALAGAHSAIAVALEQSGAR
jgi:Ankyrin repeats (3 copies)